MSERAERQRQARRRSMLPGGRRDAFVAAVKWGLPVASLLLLVLLLMLPLFANREFSFLLSKDSAGHAGERMRISEARYSGETQAGEPFEITAQSGVQRTSEVPVVVLTGLSARLQQKEGPATVTAPRGEYFINQNRLVVDGPVVARSSSGYSLDGKDIEVDIDKRQVSTSAPVSGSLPMGDFRADSFTADLRGDKVTMQGGVKLRINPGRRGA